ncbi:MAG: hypothetical protein IJZ29_04265 [Clostridia bacterium]|nr:hypothetical protein [Clostridia bacterium]
MIKIRLHGTPEEIDNARTYFSKLEKLGEIEILNLSGIYADRGASKYARLYMDAEVNEETNSILDEMFL